nr:hypothetical protein [Tanacetum cinerariifolium]
PRDGGNNGADDDLEGCEESWMTTRSAGRSTATPRGGRTDGRTSRGGGRTGEPRGRGDKLVSLTSKELRLMGVLMESRTSPQSLPNNYRTYLPLS